MLTKSKKKKRFFRTLLTLLSVLLLLVFFINIYEITEANPYILTEEELLSDSADADCILVLGCSAYADGTLSSMLKERVETGIQLYQDGLSSVLLMSGVKDEEGYDEVDPMKNAAVASGVPADCVYVDEAGINTCNSMYRARFVLGADSVIIVTQRYHLYRSVYIARSLGLDAYGVCCDDIYYPGAFARWGREVLARVKAFAYCLAKPEARNMSLPVAP